MHIPNLRRIITNYVLIDPCRICLYTSIDKETFKKLTNTKIITIMEHFLNDGLVMLHLQSGINCMVVLEKLQILTHLSVKLKQPYFKLTLICNYIILIVFACYMYFDITVYFIIMFYFYQLWIIVLHL